MHVCRAAYGLAFVLALGACTPDGAGPEAADLITPTTDTEPTTTTSTEPPTTTTTLSPEQEIVLEMGVRYAEIVEVAGTGPLLATRVAVDEDDWPGEPASLYDDPIGGCEGPVPLDHGPLTPIVQIHYATETFTSAEIYAMPVEDYAADDIEAGWGKHAEACITDVTSGAFKSTHRVEYVFGRPIVAARLDVDHTLIPSYPKDGIDPPIMDMARWFGVEDGVLYVVEVAGPEPADSLAAVRALVEGIARSTSVST